MLNKVVILFLATCSIAPALLSSAVVVAAAPGELVGSSDLDVAGGLPLDAKIQKFLGRSVNALSGGPYGAGTVAYQAARRMAIDDRPFDKPLADGRWLVSGSMAHDCCEAGAVLMDRHQRILAVGLIEAPGAGQATLILRIYARRGASQDAYVADIKAWSRAKGLHARVRFI